MCYRICMERILVPVVAGKKDIRLINHGLQLASRIGGLVFILEIDQAEDGIENETVLIPKLAPHPDGSLAAQSFEEEVRREYFQVRGDFCTEVMRFCLQKHISTLVLEIAPAGRKASPSSLLKMISSLQVKKICRVELVGKK